MSPDGLILYDFLVDAIEDPEVGDMYMISFILTNSPENPIITFAEKGMFIAAVDPEGNRRDLEFSHSGETLSPGDSLMFGATLELDQPGEWNIWPSYEIIVEGSDDLLSPTQEGPEEWHVCTLTVSTRDMPDLTPTSLSVDPEGYIVGEEANLILNIENIGSAESIECYGVLSVGGSLESMFEIPGIDKGDSVQVVVTWVPFQEGVWDLRVFVDYWISVTESDEGNNVIEAEAEITSVDTTILEIISGPTAVEVTHDSAVIIWETNKASDGRVMYGTNARIYSSEKIESTYTWEHWIQLTELNPSTTYHFRVASFEDGDRVSSRDMTFETPPAIDEARPRVSIPEPGVRHGITTIQAEAVDDTGIEKVEFYLDDVLVFSDYSPPYSFTVDTSAYENGVHQFTTTAYDTSGQFASQVKDVEFLNVKDASAPTVEITFPKKDDKVSGKIQVSASLTDDTGLGQVFFKVDGGFESFKGYPTHPKSDKVTFTLDTSTVSDGRHRLSVEVFDKDGKYQFDTVDVWISQPPTSEPPKLKVKSHTVARHDNYFVVGLTVENVGGATATNVVIQDFLKAFQPISGDDAYADYEAGFTSSTMYGDAAISSKVVIHPKQSYTYTYQAIPVLVHPDSASLTPSIGDPVRLWYDDPEGKGYYEEYVLPVPSTTNGETIPASYIKAIKTADYLIVTNPQRLSFYSPSDDVDDLLSTMAELARYRSGVLGYTTWKYAYYEQVLHGLIKDGGSWSSKLMAGWSSDGFLLIVGETEIIPSWNRVIGTFYTTAGDYTWKVVTDHPYANTVGDEKKPELNIARIIGSNAKELRKVIETSLNVLLSQPGYGFDRQKALLVSGFPSKIMGNFDGQVNAVADAIKKKTPSMTTDKINTPDFTQYNPSTGEMNETYTNLVVDNVFFGTTYGRSVIFLAGHGNWNSWDMIDRIDVSQQMDPFGWTNPFIFASSCKTGTYSGVTGISEAFLQKGAAVYLGATESGGWTPYSTKFFDVWELDEPISKAVKQVKASLGNGAKDKIWLNVYHVYGDAKFGAVPSPMKNVGYTPSSESEAPTWIDVVVPDYEIEQTGGEHSIVIPGGYELQENGRPTVPTFKVFYDYPKGYQIQDVFLEYRSPPVTELGVNIPNSIIELPTTGWPLPPPETENHEWWPDMDYEWDVSECPEGTALTLTLYPLIYNPEAQEVKFHKEYGFAVEYAISSVEITGIAADKPVYGAGEPVYVDVELENKADEGKDVVVEVFITDRSSGEVVDGLDLHTLKGLKGKASYSCAWDSALFEPGDYDVVVELRDVEGTLLDTGIESYTLGVSSAEVTGFSVEPERFQMGESVEIRMALRNTGDTSTSGTTITKIYDSEGVLIQEFSHEVPELLPAESVQAAHEWDTSGVQEGVYRVVCYAMYGGGATSPLVSFVGADDAPPNISPINPSQGIVVENLVNLQARVDDVSEVTQVTFSLRMSDEGPGGFIDPEFESMTAYYIGGDCWQLPFETTQIRDGSYVLTINAVDAFGNIGEEAVEFSVVNAPTLCILTQLPGVRIVVNGEESLTDSNGFVSITATAPSYTVEAQPVIELSEESRALFLEWEDGTQSNPRTVSASSDTTLMARYRAEHLLTIISPHGDPVGGGWYDEGTTAVFSVTSPMGFIPQHVFTGWSGDIDEFSQTSKIVMDGPKTVTANWETSYTNPPVIKGLITMMALVLILKYVRKKRHGTIQEITLIS